MEMPSTIPSPEWDVWKPVKLTRNEAVALSMNFCPFICDRIHREVRHFEAQEQFDEIAASYGMAQDDAEEFTKRLFIASRVFEEKTDFSELVKWTRSAGWHVPPELEMPGDEERSKSAVSCESETLLKHIGWLALKIAEKSGSYKLGDRLNVSAVVTEVRTIIEALPETEVSKYGASKASLHKSISDGVRLLRK